MGLQFHDFLAMGYSRKNPYPNRWHAGNTRRRGGRGFWKSGWGEGSSGTGNPGMEGGDFFWNNPITKIVKIKSPENNKKNENKNNNKVSINRCTTPINTQ